MVAGVGSEIRRVEQELGIRFPDDYRRLMAGKESLKGFFPPVGDFLELMPVGEVVGVNDAGEIQTRFPGAVVIGGDGSRELLVYDFREDPPPLTLLDITAADWSAAIYQAASLTEFLLLFPERGWVWGTSD